MNDIEEKERLRLGARIKSSEAQSAQANAQKKLANAQTKLADAQDEQVKLQKSIKTATWWIVFFYCFSCTCNYLELIFSRRILS